MSEFHEPTSDDARFDRIVDGELTSDEYRRMLAELDEGPGAGGGAHWRFWKRKRLSRELGAVREDALHVSVPATEEDIRRAELQNHKLHGDDSGDGGQFFVGVWTGIPAALALAKYQRFNSGRREQRPRSASRRWRAAADSRLAGNQNSVQAADLDTPDLPLSNVTLVVGENEANPQRFDLPVYYYGEVGDGYFQEEHSAMPPQVQEMLQRSGHRLRRTQGFVPVNMENGQQLVVPVEDVEIVPVSWPSF